MQKLWWITLLASPSWAALAATNPVVLDTVTVQASPTDTPKLAGKKPVVQVKRLVIQAEKPYQIDQVVKQVAGVHMVDLGNEQHSMSIRLPISTNPVYAYLEEGLPIRPAGIFNHNALNEVNLPAMERIAISKGAASSLYGNNAVGGALNFITRAPSPKGDAEVNMRISSEGYRRVDVGGSGYLGQWGVRASAYSADLRDNWRQNNEMDKSAATLRVDRILGDTTLWKTTLTYSDLVTDMPGSLNEADYQNNFSKSYNTFTYRKDRAWRLSSTLEGQWWEGGKTAITPYVRKNQHEQNPSYSIRSCTVSASQCPTGVVGNINSNDYTSLGLSLQHQQDWDWLGAQWLIGGLTEATNNDYYQRRIDITQDANLINQSYRTGPISRRYDVDIRNHMAYTQFSLNPIQAMRITLGGRYDWLEYGFNNQLTPSSTTGAPSETRQFSRFSPSLGMSFDINPQNQLFAQYSQAFVAPEITALYSSRIAPDLNPAIFDSYELGWRYQGSIRTKGVEAPSVELSIFRLIGKDEIVSYTIAPGNSENRNAGRTRHQGLELSAHYPISAQWQARLAAKWSEHTYETYQASPTLDYSGKKIRQAPSTVLNASLTWKPSPAWRISLEADHVRSYWMNDANTVRYAGHWLGNARISWEQKGWQVWLHGYNLGNAHHSTSASSSYSGVGTFNPNTQNSYTPGDPRTVQLGFGYRF